MNKLFFVSMFAVVVLLFGCISDVPINSTPSPNPNNDFVSVYLNDKLVFDEDDIDKDTVYMNQFDEIYSVGFSLRKNVTFDCLPNQDNYIKVKVNDQSFEEVLVSDSVCNKSTQGYLITSKSYDSAYELYSAIVYEE
ncbi:hypothetical protein KO465_05490 [Candidatus Micrarchaeota archaeon]|nr:hypothetical protein [Candidatus Micrarchaeota archaeon]